MTAAMTSSMPPKYRALSHLLSTLEHALEDGLIELDERWRDNEEAVGLLLPGDAALAAFVFTYGQPPGRYGVELSFPDAGSPPPAEPLVREELSLARLLGVLRTHFGLPEAA
ncbi:hypothetical protein CEW87_11390 [Parazoarcus communis]|uniref:Uncharacterized protein n=2 Tax=Parazoarcus communis TaxID=41977 RepID=A0A2U8H2P7_9RHOO|nr:hypothetical protein CEW87_11390 [Parazoarcus communis]|tara:strand:+ start:49859 stop:50194 length:336 start_codon:yes stop_codon:yes gene_type:complete